MANPDIGIVIGASGLSAYLSDMNRATQAGRNFANSAQNSANVVDKEFADAAKSVSKLADETSGVSKSFGSLAKDLPGIGSVLEFIGNPIGGIIAGLGAAGLAIGTFIDDASRFEEVQIQFETLIGDAGRAEDALNELADFAATTPFQFEDLAAAGRNLLAFGTTAEELTPTLRRLGDISAGIGAPLGEISEIYGKIRVQNTVYSEELNQLTGRGIPVIQELAKQFGVAEAEVKKLASTGKITFPDIERAFISLTSAGGRFAGLTQNLSASFTGQLSTFRDNIDGISRSIGQALLPAATASLNILNNLIGGTSRYSDELRNEQTELNVLITRIDSYNVGSEERATLIEELNRKYPDFLSNLDSENVTNGELRDRLKEVNEQYVNRIILQKEDEKIQDSLISLADRKREQIDAERNLASELVRISKIYNVQLLEGVSLQEKARDALEKAQQVQKSLNVTNNPLTNVGQADVLKLTGLIGRYNALIESTIEAEQDLSVYQDSRAELAKQLGIETEDLTNATDASTDALNRFSIEPTTSLKALKEQLASVRDAIELIDPSSVEFKTLNDQATALERRIAEIQGKVSIDTKDASGRIKSLNEQLAELGVNLASLNNFNELTGLADAIPLASIQSSADRAKEAIISVALEPDTPLKTLKQQLSDIQSALQLIDPQSAGFEFLASQAALLEARVNRVNNELDRLSQGGPRQPIVFPIQLDTSALNSVQLQVDGVEVEATVNPNIEELQNVTLTPPGLELRADLKIDIPNGGSLATLAEAAKVLGVDAGFLNDNFRDTQELLDTMDGTAFKLGETLSGSTEKALRFAVELRDVWAEIGQSILNNFTQQMQDLGAQIGDILVDTIGKGSAEQRAAVADLEAQIASLDKELENLPKDSESFRIIQKQADALRGQLGVLESATSRIGQAFGQFARQVLAMVLSEGTKILGVFLMESALLLGFPAGLPVLLAGAALAGLSGLVPKLILGDDNQDINVATPDFNADGIGTGGGGLGGGNFGGAAGFTSGELVQNSLNTIQAAGQPTVVNVAVQLDGQDISTALTTWFEVEAALTGG